MLDGPDGAAAHELVNALASGVMAELEVHSVHDLARVRELEHLGCLVGVHAERLVAQHVMTGADRRPDVLGVQERRRMDGHEVEVAAAQLGDGGRVACAHDVDHFAALGRREHGRDDAGTEAGADDADPHVRVAHSPTAPGPRSGRDAFQMQMREEEVTERTDAEREHDGPDPDVPAEDPTRRRARRARARVRTAHSGNPLAAMPVIRPSRGPGPRPAPMYRPIPSPVMAMPATSSGMRAASSSGSGTTSQREVDHQSDRQRVEHGPETGPLPERDPEHENDDPDDDHDRTDAHAGLGGDALVEHVVRAHPEPRLQRHRDPDAEDAGSRRAAVAAGGGARATSGP